MLSSPQFLRPEVLIATTFCVVRRMASRIPCTPAVHAREEEHGHAPAEEEDRPAVLVAEADRLLLRAGRRQAGPPRPRAGRGLAALPRADERQARGAAPALARGKRRRSAGARRARGVPRVGREEQGPAHVPGLPPAAPALHRLAQGPRRPGTPGPGPPPDPRHAGAARRHVVVGHVEERHRLGLPACLPVGGPAGPGRDQPARGDGEARPEGPRAGHLAGAICRGAGGG